MKRIVLVLTLTVCIVFLLTNEANGYPKRVLEKKRTQILFHGRDFIQIRQKELSGLSHHEDGKKSSALDIWIGKHGFGEGRRIKRAPPFVNRVIVAAIKYLMESILKDTPSVVKKGAKGKKTDIFFKQGGYKSAEKDFARFKPKDVKQFSGKNGQKGVTGNILDGKYTITARKTSTHNQLKVDGKVIKPGRPTLELRNNVNGRVTKIRYEDDLTLQKQLTEKPEEGLSLFYREGNGLTLLLNDAQRSLLGNRDGEIPDLSMNAKEGFPDFESKIDLPDLEKPEDGISLVNPKENPEDGISLLNPKGNSLPLLQNAAQGDNPEDGISLLNPKERPEDGISLLNPKDNSLSLLQNDAQKGILDDKAGEIPDLSADAKEGLSDFESNIDHPDFERPEDGISLLNPKEYSLSLLQNDAKEGLTDIESRIDQPDFGNFEIPE